MMTSCCFTSGSNSRRTKSLILRLRIPTESTACESDSMSVNIAQLMPRSAPGRGENFSPPTRQKISKGKSLPGLTKKITNQRQTLKTKDAQTKETFPNYPPAIIYTYKRDSHLEWARLSSVHNGLRRRSLDAFATTRKALSRCDRGNIVLYGSER